MKNIQPNEKKFQNSEAATIARINNLSAAIASAPDATADLIAASITTEPNIVVKGWLMHVIMQICTIRTRVEPNIAVKVWLIRFQEAFEPVSREVANV